MVTQRALKSKLFTMINIGEISFIERCIAVLIAIVVVILKHLINMN